MKIPKEEKRTLAQLREHYEIEKALANKLKHANKEDRKKLYASLYDELFTRVPHHHQISKKNDDIERNESVRIQMKLLKHFIKPHMKFLEIGAGSCHLSLEMSKYVKTVYAVDVSKEITKEIRTAENFEFVISDGCNIPIPGNSIDIAYSYQLIEHLHPNDAYEQIHNIYKAIAHNGLYICVTTNRISGPHDISKYFDEIATGFHLKEYTATDLYDLFRRCGFSEIRFCVNIKDKCLNFPFLPINMCEKTLDSFPLFLRKNLINIQPFKKLLDVITIVGLKR
jgi:ubiquinone/menaquinone biosynthesis C-methylase UbiE